MQTVEARKLVDHIGLSMAMIARILDGCGSKCSAQVIK